MVARWVAYEPWDMLIRAMSSPVSTSARMTSGDELAGPRVQSILVLSIRSSLKK